MQFADSAYKVIQNFAIAQMAINDPFPSCRKLLGSQMQDTLFSRIFRFACDSFYLFACRKKGQRHELKQKGISNFLNECIMSVSY
jgi:hypothetical protein